MTDDQFNALLKEVHAMRQSLYEVRQELAELKLAIRAPRPSREQNYIEAMDAVEVDIPDDLKHIFKT